MIEFLTALQESKHTGRADSAKDRQTSSVICTVRRADFDALFRRLAEILIRKGGYRRRLDHDCRAIVTPMANVAQLG